MGKDYFERVHKSKPESLVYYQYYENKNGVMTIPKVEREGVKDLMRKNLDGFISNNRIHFWN